ncbi:MAG: YgjP-like metallopeptidase domain-containing protein, partial [Alphaproteobacteria bacterium]
MSKSFFKRKVITSQTIEIKGFVINIEFKKIKKLYLKILNKNCQIKITAPINFSLVDISKFINEKEDWLRKSVIKIQKHQKQNQINFQENQ